MCEFKAGCPYTRIPPTTRTTSAQTTMIAVAEDGAELRMTVPEVEFDLTEYLAHDETGRHMWRFDDSRRWASGAEHKIIARPWADSGDKHVQINRGFEREELPYLIAFLISVWNELDEPPF
jgi:hypothetical protein